MQSRRPATQPKLFAKRGFWRHSLRLPFRLPGWSRQHGLPALADMIANTRGHYKFLVVSAFGEKNRKFEN